MISKKKKSSNYALCPLNHNVCLFILVWSFFFSWLHWELWLARNSSMIFENMPPKNTHINGTSVRKILVTFQATSPHTHRIVQLIKNSHLLLLLSIVNYEWRFNFVHAPQLCQVCTAVAGLFSSYQFHIYLPKKYLCECVVACVRSLACNVFI